MMITTDSGNIQHMHNAYASAHVCACACAFVFVYVHVHVHICVCVCIWYMEYVYVGERLEVLRSIEEGWGGEGGGVDFNVPGILRRQNMLLR